MSDFKDPMAEEPCPFPNDYVPNGMLAHWRDGEFATMLCVAIGLVARTHPLELRKALESVFDMEVIKSQVQGSVLIAQDASKYIAQVRELIEGVREDIDILEKRVDALRYEIEQLDLKRAKDKWDEIAF